MNVCMRIYYIYFSGIKIDKISGNIQKLDKGYVLTDFWVFRGNMPIKGETKNYFWEKLSFAVRSARAHSQERR